MSAEPDLGGPRVALGPLRSWKLTPWGMGQPAQCPLSGLSPGLDRRDAAENTSPVLNGPFHRWGDEAERPSEWPQQQGQSLSSFSSLSPIYPSSFSPSSSLSPLSFSSLSLLPSLLLNPGQGAHEAALWTQTAAPAPLALPRHECAHTEAARPRPQATSEQVVQMGRARWAGPPEFRGARGPDWLGRCGQWTPWKMLTPLSGNPRMRGACLGPVSTRSGEAVQGPDQRLQVQPPPVNQKLGVEPTSGFSSLHC